MTLVIEPVTGLPEIGVGDDVGALVAAHASVRPGDIVVVTSKVISKARGLRRPAHERELAIAEHTRRVVAERATASGPTRVVESVAGPVMAAAGVDSSSTGEEGSVLLLPTDPDGAAREVHAALASALNLPQDALGVIISDTAGRPWRHGLTDFALGVSGVRPVIDHRGEPDDDGRALAVTVRAVADELAAAADLVKGKGARVPVAVVHGASVLLGAGCARDLVRTGPSDWFSRGPVEAIRDALGVPPGSVASEQLGLVPIGVSPFADRVTRALSLALADLDTWGDAGALGADIDIGDDVASIALTAADEFLLGAAAARLMVAAAAEDLRCDHERRPVTHLSTLRPRD